MHIKKKNNKTNNQVGFKILKTAEIKNYRTQIDSSHFIISSL